MPSTIPWRETTRLKYAKNAYGHYIVSYDDGKSWSTDTPVTDLTIKTIEIGRTKVKD